MLHRTAIAVALVASSAASAADWGSFDASRINYPNGVFTTGNYADLRSEIALAGGTVAPATSQLTPQYLATIDVFFTSFLDVATGTLSAAEQAAMVDWVKCGGRLIVTCEYSAIPQNDSFLSPFGIVTETINQLGCAVPTTSHPLLAGVNQLCYAGDAALNVGSSAEVLMKNTSSKVFMAVVTGNTAVGNGSVLAVGDHTPLTDTLALDEKTFRTNLAKWGQVPPPPTTCPSATATWSSYGQGWPGTNGTPSLVLDKAPALDSTITIKLTNSGTSGTTALLIFGSQPISLPSAFGGALLVVPSITAVLSMPAGGVVIETLVPCDPSLCGVKVFGQGLMKDDGASHGVSFTAGLSMTLGS